MLAAACELPSTNPTHSVRLRSPGSVQCYLFSLSTTPGWSSFLNSLKQKDIFVPLKFGLAERIKVEENPARSAGAWEHCNQYAANSSREKGIAIAHVSYEPLALRRGAQACQLF